MRFLLTLKTIPRCCLSFSNKLFPFLRRLAQSGLALYLAVWSAYFLTVDHKKLILRALNELRPSMKALILNQESSAALTRGELLAYLDYFKFLAAAFPTTSAADTILGFLYSELGQDIEALRYFQKAFKENPKNFWAGYNTGVLHFTAGKYREAQKVLDAAISIETPEALQSIFSSRIYSDLIKSDAALQSELPNLLEKGFENAYLLRMLSFYHLGDFHLMAENCEIAFRLNIFKKESWLFYAGVAYYKLDNYKKAAEMLSQYIRSGPAEATAYEYLAGCAEASGREEIAEQFLNFARRSPRKNWFTDPIPNLRPRIF